MTIIEKGEAIRLFCREHGTDGCEKCPKGGNKFCNTYSSYDADDAVITAWYEDFFGWETPQIKDSGDRTEFASGAVRDMHEGKGRCDLLPLDVVQEIYAESQISQTIGCIDYFMRCGDCEYLFKALYVCQLFPNYETMILEVAKHFEEGAKKYGERNWQKGIPVRCYIDSAVRHYLKHIRGDKDEPHNRAFCWNILCAIWTCKHMPELNEYRQEGGDQS